jgi:hypothetical protein
MAKQSAIEQDGSIIGNVVKCNVSSELENGHIGMLI